MDRNEYAEILKSAALTAGKKAVLNVIISRIPFLANPFLNPIVAYFVGEVLEIAIKQTEIGLFFMYIDMRVGEQSKKFEEAALKNKIAQESGNDDDKKKSEEELIIAFKSFAKFNT